MYVEVVMDELLRQAKRMVMTAENARKSRDGEKWHTRRVVVPQLEREDQIYGEAWNWKKPPEKMWLRAATPGEIHRHFHKGRARYKVGDLCWIAEPHEIWMATVISGNPGSEQLHVCYEPGFDKPTWVSVTRKEFDKWLARKFPHRRLPGRFMYKSLSRTIVEIKRVWVEQVQDISEEDAKAEGCKLYCKDSDCMPGQCCNTHRLSFKVLWNSINKSRGFGWDTNPWVYVYEYELVKKLR
jgi:hypothetical protein